MSTNLEKIHSIFRSSANEVCKYAESNKNVVKKVVVIGSAANVNQFPEDDDTLDVVVFLKNPDNDTAPRVADDLFYNVSTVTPYVEGEDDLNMSALLLYADKGVTIFESEE